MLGGAAPASLGRYRILERIGAGGMGVVYAAHDPELDRRLALKVLHPGTGEGHWQLRRQQQRLLQEARALARLSDPNVITVYDAGVHEGTFFVAMELVPGVHLGRWLASGERSRDEIVNVFLEAGRGLAAAHRAGLVHRDFKPGNVMVRPDGNVIVLDFGLARIEAPRGDDRVMTLVELAGLPSLEAAPGAEPGAAGEHPASTADGAILGTPAYMAPEQRRGEAAGPAADQYAFCVALYRALTGELPKPGSRRPEAGRQPRSSLPETGAAHLPRRLRRALLRGTRLEAAGRYPGMEPLLRELTRYLDRRRRRRWAAAALVLSALAAAAALLPPTGTEALCTGGPEALARVWSPAHRSRLESALAGTGRPYSGAVSGSTARALDTYAEAWVAGYTDACRATRVRGEQSEELLDRRMACFDQRLAELGAVTELLTLEAEQTVDRAVDAAHALVPLSVCNDLGTLASPLVLPREEGTRETVASLRSQLARAKAHQDAGRLDPAEALAEEALQGAEALGYWPLTAEALLRRGLVLEARGVGEQAQETFEQALLAAGAGRHDRVAAEAFVRLVRVAGYQQADLEASQRYARQAEALLSQMRDSKALEASLADHRGVLLTQQGDFEQALRQHRQALRLRRTAGSADHPAVAQTLIRLANVQIEQGAFREAQGNLQRALELQVRALGEDHPRIATTLDRLGIVAFRRGETSRARSHHQRALRIKRASLGRVHPKTAVTLVHLGSAEAADNLQQQALERYREALDIYRESHGAGHPHVALTLNNLAAVLLDLGRGAEAAEHLHRALEIQQGIYGEDHAWVATTVFNLGAALNQMGRFEEAREHHLRALATWRRTLGEDHFLLAHGLHGLGRAEQGLGRLGEAREALERALEIAQIAEVDPEIAADIRFRLAQVLLARSGDEPRAAALAREARARLAAEPERYRTELAEIDGWLRAQDLPETGPP